MKRHPARPAPSDGPGAGAWLTRLCHAEIYAWGDELLVGRKFDVYYLLASRKRAL